MDKPQHPLRPEVPEEQDKDEELKADNRDGDVNMSGIDTQTPRELIQKKPIKVYSFSINKLSKENTRY